MKPISKKGLELAGDFLFAGLVMVALWLLFVAACVTCRAQGVNAGGIVVSPGGTGGGPSNGIPNLNGLGTNTTLLNATLNGTFNGTAVVPTNQGGSGIANGAGFFTGTSLTQAYLNTNFIFLSGGGTGAVTNINQRYYWTNLGYYTNDNSGYFITNIGGGATPWECFSNSTKMCRASLGSSVQYSNGFPYAWINGAGFSGASPPPTGFYTNIPAQAYTQVTQQTTAAPQAPTVFPFGISGGTLLMGGNGNVDYSITWQNNPTVTPNAFAASFNCTNSGFGNSFFSSANVTMGSNVYQTMVIASTNITVLAEFFDGLVLGSEVCTISNSGGVSPTIASFNCTNLGNANSAMINTVNTYMDGGCVNFSTLQSEGSYYNVGVGVFSGNTNSIAGNGVYGQGDSNTVTGANEVYINGTGFTSTSENGVVYTGIGGKAALKQSGTTNAFTGIVTLNSNLNLTLNSQVSIPFGGTGYFSGNAYGLNNVPSTNVVGNHALPDVVLSTNVPLISTTYRAGQQAIGSLSTSQAVSFSAALPGTNYAVSVTADGTLAAAIGFGVTSKTVNGFTITLSAGISGGATVDWTALMNQ